MCERQELGSLKERFIIGRSIVRESDLPWHRKAYLLLAAIGLRMRNGGGCCGLPGRVGC